MSTIKYFYWIFPSNPYTKSLNAMLSGTVHPSCPSASVIYHSPGSCSSLPELHLCQIVLLHPCETSQCLWPVLLLPTLILPIRQTVIINWFNWRCRCNCAEWLNKECVQSQASSAQLHILVIAVHCNSPTLFVMTNDSCNFCVFMYMIKEVSQSDRQPVGLFPTTRLWNSLPENLRAAETVDVFKKRLKTHLFNQAFIWFLYSF